MRRFAVRFFAAAVGAVVLVPALLAQPGPGGFGDRGGQMSTSTLLANKSVQEELKLTPEQITKYEKVSADLKEKFGSKTKEAFSSMDKEKMQAAFKAMQEESTKAADLYVKENLMPEQTKRLQQIEVQVTGLQAFTRDDVKKALKLTDKQSADIKVVADEIRKDIDDLRKEAFSGGGRPDQDKMTEVRKKTEALNKEGMDRVRAILSADQKKAWTELTGPRFDIRIERRPPQ